MQRETSRAFFSIVTGIDKEIFEETLAVIISLKQLLYFSRSV